jgi:hypothetical protein
MNTSYTWKTSKALQTFIIAGLLLSERIQLPVDVAQAFYYLLHKSLFSFFAVLKSFLNETSLCVWHMRN